MADTKVTTLNANGLKPVKRGQHFWIDSWIQLLQKRKSVFGLVVVLLFILVSIFGPGLAPHDPLKMDLTIDYLPPAWVAHAPMGAGNPDYLLGTDMNGRDVLSRLIYGTRSSALIGFISVALIALMGTLVGATSGYIGGRFDGIVMRLTDILYAFPAILFYVMIVLILRDLPIAKIGGGMLMITVALVTVGWVGMARLVRGAVLVLKQELYVEAAHSIGVPGWKILFRHILPNCFNLILVYMTFAVPRLILTEATLGYLGINILANPDDLSFFVTSWGGLFLEGRRAINVQPSVLISVLIASALVAVAFTYVGDGLRDALDPKMRQIDK